MNDDSFAADDLLDLERLMPEALEPVDPPAAVKAKLMQLVRATPQDTTIPADSVTVRASEGKWYPQPAEGVEVKPLSFDRQRGIATILMKFQPGAVYPPHDHHGTEQTFVVSGSCRIGDVALHEGDFHRVPPGSHHGAVISDGGCTLLLVVDEYDAYVA